MQLNETTDTRKSKCEGVAYELWDSYGALGGSSSLLRLREKGRVQS